MERESLAAMSTIVSSVAGAGFCAMAVLASADAASAASPAYCALYAREYASQFALPATAASADSMRLQDQAYYRCLNLDEDPAFPTTSAYFGADADAILAGSGGAMAAIEEQSGAKPKAATATREVASAGKPRRPGRGSGYDAWTPEWFAWCEANYRSFDPETGYVKTYGGTRKLCP